MFKARIADSVIGGTRARSRSAVEGVEDNVLRDKPDTVFCLIVQEKQG